MIVSVHLPKTAGSTIKHILHKAFGWRVFFDYGDQYAFTDPKPPDLRDRLRRARLNAKYRPFLLPSDRCVHGHFRAMKYAGRFPDATYTTWMRDPVERVISHYHHWKRNPDPSHSVCRALHANDWTLLEFARQDPMRDIQARYLDGIPLREFAFVGVQERLDPLLPRFFDVLGVAPIRVETRNVNDAKPVDRRYDVADEVRSEIDALNAEDRRLYREAIALLGEPVTEPA